MEKQQERCECKETATAYQVAQAIDLAELLFKLSPDLLAIVGFDGSVQRVNEGAVRLSGYSATELLSLDFRRIIHPQEFPSIERQLNQTALDGRPFLVEARLVTKSGEPLWCEWRGIRKDERTLVVVSREMTRRKEQGPAKSGLEGAGPLMEAKGPRQAYERLLELIFDMVITLSSEAQVVDINDAGTSMLGASSPEEIIGQPLRRWVAPDHYEAIAQSVAAALRGGKTEIDTESQVVTVDGRILDVEVFATIGTRWRGAPAVRTFIRDITDRKLARTTLKAREDYFETLADLAPEGIFQLDRHGRVVYANKRCGEILGREEIVGTSWEHYFDVSERGRARGEWAAAVREQRPFLLEFRFLRSDGESVWLRCKAVVDRGTSGDLAGYIGILADITSFKMVTEQLLDAERRARKVVEVSFDIVMLIEGPGTVIAEINESGALLLRGQSGADFIGRPVTDILFPSDHAAITQCIRAAMETQTASPVCEFRVVRRDATVLEVEGAAIPVVFQGKPSVYVVYRDITERKAAEGALRKKEHHLAMLAKAAPVGIFQADLHGQCVYANQRYLSITGYSFDEIQGLGWWEHVVPEDCGEVRNRWQTSVARRDFFEREYRLRRKDGRVIWVLCQAVPEPNEAGEILGYIGSITDINQGKLDEIELHHYREHLEDMVRERTIELEAVNRELESFSYSVSHDLRGPLRAINGFNSALLEEYGDKLDDQAQFFLRRMRANTRQMSQLIDDLLELSKVTQAELRREWLDLSALAETILFEFRLADPDRKVEMAVVPHIKAFGDSQLLRVLMQNLLSNAWKYTSRSDSARIEFGAMDTGGTRAFYVRDNGAGFDMACVQHLFRAFHRLHEASEFEGTGIGLATVHRIVTRHGGKVWAEGEEGKGATFFFVLH